MFSSVFLFIMLLAFKHTHLISDLDVFPCIPLLLLSSCTFRAFFDKPPCPTSLNIVLYPSHWQPPLRVPCCTSMLFNCPVPFKLMPRFALVVMSRTAKHPRKGQTLISTRTAYLTGITASVVIVAFAIFCMAGRRRYVHHNINHRGDRGQL